MKVKIVGLFMAVFALGQFTDTDSAHASASGCTVDSGLKLETTVHGNGCACGCEKTAPLMK